jgi:hypothetical protein
VQVTETVPGEQTIFALDQGGSLRLGLDDGKPFAEGEAVHVPATATIVSEVCLSGQCLFMQHNDATWQGTRQQVGQLTPGDTYTLTAASRPPSATTATSTSTTAPGAGAAVAAANPSPHWWGAAAAGST